MPRKQAQIGEFIEPVWRLVEFTGNNCRGKKASKGAKHSWLRSTYGRPSYCMNTLCDDRSTWYDWALKTGRAYSHNPYDYLWLCRRCHRKYDLTDEKRKQAIKNLWWKQGVRNPGRVNYQNLWFRIDKVKTKEYYEKRQLGGSTTD